jgi:hypothetical protein
VKSKTEDELVMLTEGGPVRVSASLNLSSSDHLKVWSSYSVLNVLYSLMQKSRINEYIIAQREGKSPEEIAFVQLRSLLSGVLTFVQGNCWGVWSTPTVQDAWLFQRHWPSAGSCPAR